MTNIERGIRALARASPAQQAQMAVTASDIFPTGYSYSPGNGSSESAAMRLAAVNACVEILSDSIGKLPVYVFDTINRTRIAHPLNRLLNIRPNEAMTPFDRKKMLEANRLTHGNSFDWIYRDPRTFKPAELIPIPSELMTWWRDANGHMWYQMTNPINGETMVLPGADVMHYKGYSHDGITGISVLSRAREVIEAGLSAQQYDKAFYANGARLTGVLQTDGDVSGYREVVGKDGSIEKISYKEIMRQEWEKCYTGSANSFRTAILDRGLKYTPISISNADAQFIERQKASVEDIARFFGVPLYKLQAGKQAYGSNEQNAIEYVTGKVHPTTTIYAEEHTYKLLPDAEIYAGFEVRINMMAELKGDVTSRGSWYKTMREVGGFSANDIRDLEDMPKVEGGDEYYASWNYGPLSKWAELSVKRAEKTGQTGR